MPMLRAHRFEDDDSSASVVVALFRSLGEFDLEDAIAGMAELRNRGELRPIGLEPKDQLHPRILNSVSLQHKCGWLSLAISQGQQLRAAEARTA